MATQSKKAGQGGNRRMGVLKDTTRLAVRKKTKFLSKEAREIYDNVYEDTEIALYSICTVLPAIGGDEAGDKAIAIAKEQIEEVRTDLERSIELMKAVREKNNVSQDVFSTEPVEVEAPVSSPQAAEFLGLIKSLDEMAEHMTILWVEGAMSPEERRARWNGARKSIVKLSRDLIRANNRAIRTANQQKNAERQKAEAQERKRAKAKEQNEANASEKKSSAKSSDENQDQKKTAVNE